MENKSAAQLLASLLAADADFVYASLHPYGGHRRLPKRVGDVPRADPNRANAAADPTAIKALAAQYGAVSDALLNMYAAHDGAALFVEDDFVAISLLPIVQWLAQSKRVMAWAREVLWSSEPEDMPTYLQSAIPFCRRGEETWCWLLITEGRHAGKIMFFDEDVLDESPSFGSLQEFMATLILDPQRILV
jgi:hypothetical protein